MMDIFTNWKRFGVFGPSECGKSTLAHHISRQIYLNEGRFTVALVPMDADVIAWGAHTTIFRDKEQFLTFVRSQRGYLVAVEDASLTINRDGDMTDFFTCIRHQNHKLLVMGHDATNLTRQMRDNIQRIFLFLQNQDGLEFWRGVFPGCDLSPALHLQQYEFITAANFQPVIKSKIVK